MTRPLNDELQASSPRWVQICGWVWKGLIWLWGAIILGIGINVGSTWLIAQTVTLTKTPLGWLIAHASTTILVGIGLISLTVFTGLVTAFRKEASFSFSSLSLQQQNRSRFLAKLQIRYTDILEQSLHGATQITLGLRQKSDAVLNSTRFRFRQPSCPEQDLPPGTSILQVYERSGGELLILGAPGAGKTIQLVNLALALCNRAIHNEQQPIPVIVNLSTWANSQQPLQDWLVEEVARTYDVPRPPLIQWTQADQLLPLLDGLDEVEDKARTACIEAINTFRQAHLVPLVVCSRQQEYDAQARRLALQTAVILQPLEEDQVVTYLKDAGKSLSGFRSFFRNDVEFRELLTTPLMLHIATLAYWGVSVQALPQKGTKEEQRQQLIEQYVKRRLEHLYEKERFSSQDARHWLCWLARQMRKHNQTIFYLEHLQPDWLPEGGVRKGYECLATKGAGIVIGVVLSLFITTLTLSGDSLMTGDFLPHNIWYGCAGGLLGGVISGGEASGFQLKGILTIFLQQWRSLGLLSLWNGLLVGGLVALGFVLRTYLYGDYEPYDWLIYGSSLGLCGSLLTIIITSGKQIAQQRSSPTHRQYWWRHIGLHGLQPDHLRLGITVGLLLGLSWGLSAGLSWGLGVGLTFGAIGVFLSLLLAGKKSTIELAEILVWSRQRIVSNLTSKHHLGTSVRLWLLLFLFFGFSWGFGCGLSVGLSCGLSCDIICWLSKGISSGASIGLSVSLTYWLLSGLWSGLSQEILDDHFRTRPNQGIRRSMYNAFFAGLLAGVICFLLSIFVRYISNFVLLPIDLIAIAIRFGLHFTLYVALPELLRVGVLSIVPYSNALVLGCLGFLLAALLTGGLTVIRHFLLRLQLRHLSVMPWHVVRFLDDATLRILLYKDGGGYRFIHRLFQDYFADIERREVSDERSDS